MMALHTPIDSTAILCSKESFEMYRQYRSTQALSVEIVSLSNKRFKQQPNQHGCYPKRCKQVVSRLLVVILCTKNGRYMKSRSMKGYRSAVSRQYVSLSLERRLKKIGAVICNCQITHSCITNCVSQNQIQQSITQNDKTFEHVHTKKDCISLLLLHQQKDICPKTLLRSNPTYDMFNLGVGLKRFLYLTMALKSIGKKRKRQTETLMLCLSVVNERAITNTLLLSYCKYEHNFFDVCPIIRDIPHLWLAMQIVNFVFSLFIFHGLVYVI